MRKTVVLSLLLALVVAANAFAGAEARMSGKLIDAGTKKPIANGIVKFEAIEGKTVKGEAKSKADGSFALFVLDGTIQYKFTYMADGYAPFEEVLKLKTGGTTEKEVELFQGSGKPGAPVIMKIDPTVEIYNEGAKLNSEGDTAGALAKFEASVAAKPDFLAGWSAIAKVSLKTKNYPRAIEAAKKVLDVDDSDTDMWGVLYQVYTATGDKANAAIAQKKLPANAALIFNDAVHALNARNYEEAQKLLEQAVALPDCPARAHYELGILYIGANRTADAKAQLTKYIELDPQGKDVASVKEMLKYLQ